MKKLLSLATAAAILSAGPGAPGLLWAQGAYAARGGVHAPAAVPAIAVQGLHIPAGVPSAGVPGALDLPSLETAALDAAPAAAPEAVTRVGAERISEAFVPESGIRALETAAPAARPEVRRESFEGHRAVQSAVTEALADGAIQKGSAAGAFSSGRAIEDAITRARSAGEGSLAVAVPARGKEGLDRTAPRFEHRASRGFYGRPGEAAAGAARGVPALVRFGKKAEGGSSWLGSLWAKLTGKSEAAPAPEKPDLSKYELKSEDIRRKVPASSFGFESTADIEEHTPRIVGQDRAMRQLREVLEMEGPENNVYVKGEGSSGRRAAVEQVLREIAPSREAAPDIVTIPNLKEGADEPLTTLRLQAGQGPELKRDLESLKRRLAEIVPAALQDPAVQMKVQAIVARTKVGQVQQEINQFELKGIELGLARSQMGMVVVPVQNGQMADLEQLVKDGKLTEEEAAKIEQAAGELNAALQEAGQDQKEQEAIRAKVEEIHAQAVSRVVLEPVARLMKKYAQPEVQEYLERLMKAIVEQHHVFDVPEEKSGVGQLFKADVVVSNDGKKGAPVEFVQHPTYESLFGEIDLERTGEKSAKFNGIKPGAFQRADGGYLYMYTWDLIREPGLVEALINAVRNGEAETTNVPPGRMAIGMQKISVTTKANPRVVLIGPRHLHALLHQAIPEFGSLFPHGVDFEPDLPFNDESKQGYIDFVKKIVVEEGLKEFSGAAIGALVQFAFREADSNSKVTAQFGKIAKLMQEADYYAEKAGKKQVDAEAVEAALAARLDRASFIQRRRMDYEKDEAIRLKTTGEALNQANGLGVSDHGSGVAFGFPIKLTVVTGASAGPSQVVFNDQVAGNVGPSTKKAITNTRGWLRHKYAAKMPFVGAEISVSFEQIPGLDGDSATGIGMSLIAASLAGVPVKQSIAMTGSADQFGNIQSIGGVNEKIEGFFDVASQHGLDGTQGVIVPFSDVRNLMLRPDIAEAVEAGKFHIWQVRTVDEAIEIFTGLPAGERGEDGRYPEGTVHRMAEDQLKEYAKAGQALAKAD